MGKLQRPPFVFMGGRITPWDEAKIHVGAEALTRGISVFEGIKGYWNFDGSALRLLAMREHYERLVRSAALQHLPFEWDYPRFFQACAALVRELRRPERDLWVRATLLSIDGQWGENTTTDLVITSYHQEPKRPEPLDVGVSTWRKPDDASMPARIKSAANYQLGRMARIEGRRQGFADMIVLNGAGRVAEASASAVLMVRRGVLCTPPASEGCLESITVDLVEALARSLDVPFERRPIERSELLVCDEACLAGTLMELAPIRSVEGRALPERAPVLEKVADAFWACVRGEREHPAVRLEPV